MLGLWNSFTALFAFSSLEREEEEAEREEEALQGEKDVGGLRGWWEGKLEERVRRSGETGPAVLRPTT